MTRLALFGSEGRMGVLLRQCAEEAGAYSVVARYDRIAPGLPASEPLPADVDAVVDFSSAAAWQDLGSLLEGNSVPLVSGTTGTGSEGKGMLELWAGSRAVFHSANMSRGIHVLCRLTSLAARLAGESGGGFDLEIVESHHRGKLDSPSGTALMLLESWESVIGGGRHVYGRGGEDRPRSPRSSGEVGIHSVRGGDVVGEHRVLLLGDGERLELGHSATSRRTFALGALAAVDFVMHRSSGLYGMDDLVGGGVTQ
ncbi:4-hydroxy-tetrahydrodipicolinate reductase [Candidatus Fermentibacterales bacterium]|nr:4-hydroxy-tetrahydrodipicolinate reductase [Candidatus Fermentibacterales bacterium]